MSSNLRAPPGRPVGTGIPGSRGVQDPVDPSSDLATDSRRARLRGSLPLVLGGASLLSGAWLASVDRIRIFNSIFPLWILLALNGAILAIAGIAALLLKEADPAIEDDPNLVRVYRAQWEALFQNLGVPPVAGGPPSWMTDGGPSWAALAGAESSPYTAGSGSGRATDRPSGSAPAFPGEVPDDSSRGPRVGPPEPRTLAQSGIFTAASHRGDHGPRMLDGSPEELTRLAERLGAPRQTGESSPALLARLRRLPPPRFGSPQDAGSSEVVRRTARPPTETTAAPPSRTHSAPNGPHSPAVVEFDALLREVERAQNRTRRTKGHPATAKAVDTRDAPVPESGVVAGASLDPA
jgi:hypothetical protein